MPRGSRTECGPKEESALGRKNPGGKGWGAGSGCPSCDPEALRELLAGAECAEENLPLRAVAWLAGNLTDKDQVGVIHAVPNAAKCLDLHTLDVNSSANKDS